MELVAWIPSWEEIQKRACVLFFYGEERRKGEISVFHCEIDFCISHINVLLRDVSTVPVVSA